MPDERWQQLEKEAAELKSDGKNHKAIQKLEEALEIKKYWYQYFYYLMWKLEIKDYDELDETFKHVFSKWDNEIYKHIFLILEAKYYFQKAETESNQIAIRLLDKAYDKIKQAEDMCRENFHIQFMNRQPHVPHYLSEPNRTFLDRPEKPFDRIMELKNYISLERQRITLKGEMQKQKKNIELYINSEKIKFSELLGVFTAILALIFSGVSLLNRNFDVLDVLTILITLALVLTIFFWAMHTLIFNFIKWWVVIPIIILLLILLFFISLSNNKFRPAMPDKTNEIHKVEVSN